MWNVKYLRRLQLLPRSAGVNGSRAIVVLHVRLSAFISRNPLLFIPSAVTQLKIGCHRRSAASERSPSVRFCTD